MVICAKIQCNSLLTMEVQDRRKNFTRISHKNYTFEPDRCWCWNDLDLWLWSLNMSDLSQGHTTEALKYEGNMKGMSKNW